MPLSISVLATPDELEGLRSAWDDLLSRSDAEGPMRSPLWLLPWWRVFGAPAGRRLAVACFHDGPRLAGLAPFVARTRWYPPGIPFRRLELLGTGEPAEHEVCSEHLGLVAERGAEPAVARAFAEALAGGALGPWDELVLGPMDRDDPSAAPLAAELAGTGAGVEIDPAGPAYYIELPPSYAEYTARLSPSSRYLLTRSMRDFEVWSGGAAVVHAAASPAGLEEGKRALAALHGERWAGGGAFASPRFRDFHDEVMAALLAEGALELLWITVGGEPFAAAYDIVRRGRVYYYQSGRRLDVPRNIRPGIVLHARAVERAIAAGHREYDFLLGTQRYKRELATACRSVVRLRAVRSPGALREEARRLADRSRAAARAVRTAIRGGDRAGTPGREAADEGGASCPAAVLPGDLNMLRCFAGTGVRTVVLSSDPDAPTFFSRHCGQRRMAADAAADPRAALADLVLLGKLLPGRPVLYYGDDAMLLLVSRHRAELRERFRFSLPDAARVEALVDKIRFAKLASELGLPVPRTVTSAELRTAAEIARAVPPPWIVKPSCHLGWRYSPAVLGLGVGPVKALAARDVAELGRVLDRVASFSPEIVVQEHVPGGEEEVHSFHAYLDGRGKVLGHYVGRKIRTYPRNAGVSTYVELCAEPELTRMGLAVLERLELRGVVKLDWKRDPRTGRFYLLEVNPRFSLWNHLGAASGVNLPLLAYRDLAGISAEPAPPARTGVRWLSFGDDARAFVRGYAPAGELTLAGWLRSLRGSKVYDVFAWDDPSPFVMHVARSLGGRARR
jgi:D-aspartate ligase